MLFDTHAHLEDEQLRPSLPQILTNAREAGLVGITAVGTTLTTSQECLSLAQSHPEVYAAVGIHPNYCQDATDDQWAEIKALATANEAVAIGETGLDRHWDYCPIERQREWFARHIELSFATQKPLVIHMRDCEQDIVEMLSEHQRDGKILGVMHSFAGSWETAEFCLELDMYISFAGMLTFKKSHELREIAAKIPADRLLVETDSPYLSPHPHRGQRPNEPAMVQHTAQCLADVREVSSDEIGKLTTDNAKRFFGLEN